MLMKGENMDKKLAFIGTGNMGGALIKAVCRTIDPQQVFITNRNPEKAEQLAEETGCRTVQTNQEAVREGDYIFLCVKPQGMGEVLKEISPVLNQCMEKNQPRALISIAAGLTIEGLRDMLEGECRKLPWMRIMPNTPVAVGKGLLALAADDQTPEFMVADMEHSLSQAGRMERIPEGLMDQFTVVGGCSPAFVYVFLEALADGGVRIGLPRQQALTYAAQAVLGAASMVLETGQHPGSLKDAVCSPNGSTIAGVAALEKAGFRSAAMEAVWEGYQRNVELGKTK